MARMGKETENWEYVSGRCACLETALLGKDFFRELLRSRTAAQAFTLLSATAYGAMFPEVRSLPDYDLRLRENLRRGISSIQDDSPSPVVGRLFQAALELEEVHTFLTQKSIARSSPGEIKEWVRKLSDAYKWVDELSLTGTPEKLFILQPVRAVSFWVDAAFLISLLNLRESCPGLNRYIQAELALSSFGVCWRAWGSGLKGEWLEAFFWRGKLREEIYPGVASVSRKDWSSLSRVLAPAGFRLEAEGFSREFSRAADDYLTRVAEEGKFQATGPERVFYYLRRLWVEDRNLRLSLAAVLVPLDRAQVELRLRYG